MWAACHGYDCQKPMMPPDLFAFTLFAIAMSVTPGPNNIMVAAEAANHGMRATFPHMLGICVGLGAMVAAIGLGLATPLSTYPALHAALRWVGGAWMLWIAWSIVRSDPAVPSDGQPAVPMGFCAAALFQWVNPKAWVMAIVASTTYTVPNHALMPQVMLLAVLFTLIGLPCILSWSLLGAGAGRVLRTPAQMRTFNAAMAGLLVLSVLPLLVG